MTPKNQKPHLDNYLNVSDFLKDFYSYRKAIDARFSYEIWAKELGLTNRSFLRQIIAGQRSLTENIGQIFCANLGLTSQEQEYFRLLVLYSNARTAESRSFIWARMRPMITKDAMSTEIKSSSQFTLKTLYPRLQAMLCYEDAPRDSRSLSQILNVPEPETVEALGELERMGLIEKVEGLEKVEWRTKTKFFKVPEDLGNEKLLDFHSSCLKEAIAARVLPSADRRYRSLLLAFNEDELKEFLADFESFVQQSFFKFDGDKLDLRKLYQINFNFHAVSQKKLKLESSGDPKSQVFEQPKSKVEL